MLPLFARQPLLDTENTLDLFDALCEVSRRLIIAEAGVREGKTGAEQKALQNGAKHRDIRLPHIPELQHAR